MKKRMVLTLLGVAVFIGAIAFIKVRQIQAGMAKNASFQPPPEAVTTVKATQDRWPMTVEGIGTVTAVHGVMVAADLPGIVAQISFESGKKVRAGDVLVRLDTRQEQAQLAAAEAQLREWLVHRPSYALFQAAIDVIKAGLAHLTPPEREGRLQEIVNACREVSEASGGIAKALGIGSGISSEERTVLDQVTAALRAP